jgi:nitroimidazol reductase NimA-like FMN-containing flavoprotein (pyridoxamine 5'-phosphate oxidase superfamily)
MRKTNREIHGTDALYAVMRQCDVCYLSLFDAEYPYVVPLNFGVELLGSQIILYFHCAGEGRKLDLLAKNAHVGFSMSCGHTLKAGDRACDCSMNFSSVCGTGTLEIVDAGEKVHALSVLMENYALGQSLDFDPKVVAITTVLSLTVNHSTGKRLEK